MNATTIKSAMRGLETAVFMKKLENMHAEKVNGRSFNEKIKQFQKEYEEFKEWTKDPNSPNEIQQANLKSPDKDQYKTPEGANKSPSNNINIKVLLNLTNESEEILNVLNRDLS